jgi:hypothetical protein
MTDSPRNRAPAWAVRLGDAGFFAFIETVERYFARRKLPIELNSAEGVLIPSSGHLNGCSLGLQNIAQKCQAVPRERWSMLIDEHFDSLFVSGAGEDPMAVDMRDFESLRSRLRVRLYPESILKQTMSLVQRPLAEGLLEVIVLDLPKSVRTISRSEIDGWPLDEDGLFMLGRKNLASSCFLEETRVQLPGSDLHTLTGDSFYTASHLLVLERYISRPMPHGLLLSAPKRDVILKHYIQDIGVVEAISGMLDVTVSMYDDGPGSLSPHLYWYRNGAYTTLNYAVKDGGFSLMPPSDFSDLLNDLSMHAQLS